MKLMIQIDMEMPKSCKECSLPHIIVNGNYCYSSCSTGRPDWCPLHEVTEDPDTVSRQDARMCLTGDVTDMSIEQYIKMVDRRLEQLPPSPTPGRPKICKGCIFLDNCEQILHDFCPHEAILKAEHEWGAL